MVAELVSSVATKESELRNLMIASQSGNAESHRALLSKLSGYLRAYFKARLSGAGRGSEESEDLVQEVLMAVHTRRHTYDPDELFTPWVYAIARYKLIDHLRQSRARTADVPIERASEILAADDHAATDSTIDIGRLLAALPEKVRVSIQCVKIDGLSVTETATRIGISESAVKVNVHRGLKALSTMVSRSKPT